MSIRILIADDHRLLRAGLKSLLNSETGLEVVGEATCGSEVIELAQTLNPDIVLLDISMPDTDALATTRKLLEVSPISKVLMLTMHEDTALMQEYLRVGASGYIIKRAAETELIDAIFAVTRGIIYVHPSLMHAMLDLKPKSESALLAETEPLTLREIEILRFIVQGHTNREIASTLNISIRTVESHRSNLMEKLNLHSRVDLVRYASKFGLLKADDFSNRAEN